MYVIVLGREREQGARSREQGGEHVVGTIPALLVMNEKTHHAGAADDDDADVMRMLMLANDDG